MRCKQNIKKLTIDLNSKSIPDNVKTVIIEQTGIIKIQQEEIARRDKELSALRKENEELKKNFN